jgi:signal peptidase I
MAKDSKSSDIIGDTEPVFISGLAAGGIIAAIGIALYLVGGRYAMISGFDWLQMGGILLVVVGVMIAMSGDLTKSAILDWVRSLGYALLLALLIRWPIAEPYRIPSNSMAPTLDGQEGFGAGDRIFVNKWVYGVRVPFMNARLWYGQEPQRWDIVVFKAVEENAQHPTLVKRIVGMPGERLHIMNGRVWRFFRPGDEIPAPEAMPDFIWEEAQEFNVQGDTTPWTFVPLRIPDFMPKDQRYVSQGGTRYAIEQDDAYSLVPEGNYLLLGDNSGNSRDGRYWGWVPNENFVGRVSCIWWPPRNWRDFTGFSDTWWWRSLLTLLGVYLVWRLFIGRSLATHGPDGKTTEHLYIDYLGLGLRVPMSRAWLVRWSTPRRGDRVVFWAEVKGHGEPVLLAGRVAATGGERIGFDDGAFTVNGEPLMEPAFQGLTFDNRDGDAAYGRSKSKQFTEVPEGHLFILAAGEGQDNTAIDSRNVGWVPVKHLAGRVRCTWWNRRKSGKTAGA